MITVCIASYNAKEALVLSVESLKRHHPNTSMRIVITDNGSTDGAKDYARSVADVFYDRPEAVEHGTMLEQMVADTDSQFVLTMDNDVEVLGPVLEQMQVAIQNGAFCCCHADGLPETWEKKWFDFRGVNMVGQPRINPCFALFDGNTLREMLKHIGFGTYCHYPRSEFYDTGSMLFKISSLLGHRTVAMPPGVVFHYGSVSGMIRTGIPDDGRIAKIKAKAAGYQTKVVHDGLTRIDKDYRLQYLARQEIEPEADPNGINPVYFLARKMCQGTGIDIGGSIGGRLDQSILGGAAIADPAIPGTGSATDLSKWGNSSVDYVVSSHCLEHVDEPERCMKEVFRVLKPGGIAFFYLPHHTHVGWNPKLLEEVRPAHKWQPDAFGMGRLFLLIGLEVILLEQDCDDWDGFLAIGRKSK